MLFLFIVILIIIYIVLYNKIYYINVDTNNVYEVLIKTSYPYQEKTLTDDKEIEMYLETLQKIRFTHPSINTGKGWETAVTIKSRNSDGINTEYSFFLLNNYIQKGHFCYKIISE